jgi:PAS domain S-box-containing protein
MSEQGTEGRPPDEAAARIIDAFRSRPGAFMVLDDALRVRWAASHLHAARGQGGSVTGRPVGEVLHVTDGVDDAWFAAVRNGGARHHAVQREGRRWLMRAEPVPGPDGREWVTVDLAVEEDQPRAEARTRTVLELVTDGAQVGTWAWNRVTGELEWNAWHARLFGFPAVAGRWRFEDFADRIHPDDRAAMTAAMANAVATGDLYQHEFRVTHPDGSVRHLRNQGRVVEGEPYQMVGIAVDVTESVAAVERERRLLRRLADADRRARTALAADIHDGALQQLFVAKLTAAGALRTLKRDGALDARGIPRLERLLDAIERAQSGLREVLAGLAAPLVDAPLPLGRVLARIATDIFAGRPCELVHDGDLDVLVPPAEAQTAMQIAGEAILNACKHAECTMLRVFTTVTRTEVAVTVQDDGVGFDPDALGPIGHYGRSVMAGRAEAAGGSFSTESSPGRGTLVSFRLPVLPADADAALRTPASSA